MTAQVYGILRTTFSSYTNGLMSGTTDWLRNDGALPIRLNEDDARILVHHLNDGYRSYPVTYTVKELPDDHR